MEKDRTKEEYELQHFNFTAEEIVAQNEQLIRSALHKTMCAFTEQLVEKRSISNEAADELRSKIVETCNEIHKDCQPAIDALSALYRETFSIPEWLLLPTDLLHKNEPTDQEFEELQRKVSEAKKAVDRGAVFLASLEAELEVHRALEPSLQAERQVIDAVEESQRQVIDMDELLDLVKRVEAAGLLEDESHAKPDSTIDNILLQK
ncbi:uncharacterized protein LOC131208486 [Anopheles bellator]|uniref:uncharacterized protein LOC131208486 n=1 Tax=Anopheles bellator TaxID=139047 RepID=UPI0026499D26|nr:uncharacterized protein LOC131208486 [Anopheles bellator]